MLQSLSRLRRAFSLIESLVVVAILGVLISLMLPAVQASREATRRAQCLNHLRQIGLAMHQYHATHDAFPAGFIWPDRTLWTALVLPQLDQHALYDSLQFGLPWDVDGSANETACGTMLPVFRCPSTDAPQHIDFEGIPARVPGNYLGCASGVVDRETGSAPRVGQRDMDGLLFHNSATRIADVLDGTSTTMLVGESLNHFDIQGIDFDGNQQRVDHWYIGSSDDLVRMNASEALGSTAIRINAVLDVTLSIDQKELCFSSDHLVGVQVAFGDGHVRLVSEAVDEQVWSAFGTRAGGEPGMGFFR